jgi:hypothetical protein
MSQKNTKVTNKSSGDTFTAEEFNNLNIAVNRNAADVESRVNSIVLGNDFVTNNLFTNEVDKFWISNYMDTISNKHWLISKMSDEILDVVDSSVAWVSPSDGVIYDIYSAASTPATVGDVAISVKINNSGVSSATMSNGSSEAVHPTLSEPVTFNSGDNISFVATAGSAEGAAGLHTSLQVSWGAVIEDDVNVWIPPEDGKIHGVVSSVSHPVDGNDITIDVKRNGSSILEATGIIPVSGYSTTLGTPHELDFDPRVFLAGDVISFENINDVNSRGLRTDLKISLGTEGGVGQSTVVYEANYDNPDKVAGDIPLNWKGYASIKHLKIGKSAQTIGSRSFEYSGLTGKVLIPSNVTSIGNSAFEMCTDITSLIFEEGCKTIDSSAFQRCGGLIGDLVIPNTVTDIAFAAFFNCSGLNGKLILGTNLLTIANNCFELCNFTGDLVIPNSVTTIGNNVFRSCDFDGHLLIPNSVTSIGEFVFQGCPFSSVYLDTPITSWTGGDALKDIYQLVPGSGPITIYVNDIEALGYTAGPQDFQGANTIIAEWENYPNPIPNTI